MKGERWNYYAGPRETSVLLIGYSVNDLVVKNLECPVTWSKKMVGITLLHPSPPPTTPGSTRSASRPLRSFAPWAIISTDV